MATGKPWQETEVAAVLAAYFHILNQESAGKAVNKAAIRRATLPKLEGRSAGSYELKMCNISAAMVKLGLPFVKGYKPYGHGQQLIEVMIKAKIAEFNRYPARLAAA